MPNLNSPIFFLFITLFSLTTAQKSAKSIKKLNQVKLKLYRNRRMRILPNKSKLCVPLPPFPPDGGCHVGVSVHEALHSRGNVPAPSGLLPASPQQLLRLLWPIPPSGCLGWARSQSLLNLLRGLPPDELLQLPCPPQVSRVWTNVLLTLLRQRTSSCVSTIGSNLICLDFGIKFSNNLIFSSLKHSKFPLQVSWWWRDSLYPPCCWFLVALFGSVGSNT